MTRNSVTYLVTKESFLSIGHSIETKPISQKFIRRINQIATNWFDYIFQDPENSSQSDYNLLLDQLYNRFGDIHSIRMSREELQMDPDWIHGCLAKLFVHSRLYQVSLQHLLICSNPSRNSASEFFKKITHLVFSAQDSVLLKIMKSWERKVK